MRSPLLLISVSLFLTVTFSHASEEVSKTPTHRYWAATISGVFGFPKAYRGNALGPYASLHAEFGVGKYEFTFIR